MSFEPWHENEVLVRFEHILEKDEDPEYSKTVQFNIQSVLSSLKIFDIRETMLAGNTWLADNQRMEFVPDEPEVSYNSYGIYQRSLRHQLLLQADRPLLSAKYYNQAKAAKPEEEDEQLAMLTNRIKRVAEAEESQELNRERAEKLRKLKMPRQTLAKEYAHGNDRFIVELSPMQMRTYILTLQKDN